MKIESGTAEQVLWPTGQHMQEPRKGNAYFVKQSLSDASVPLPERHLVKAIVMSHVVLSRMESQLSPAFVVRSIQASVF
jgi:hypothetical protein